MLTSNSSIKGQTKNKKRDLCYLKKNAEIQYILKKEQRVDDTVKFIGKVQYFKIIKNKKYFITLKSYFLLKADQNFCIMEVQKANSKFYLLKVFINSTTLYEISNTDSTFKMNNKSASLEYLHDLSNYIKVKRMNTFNALIVRPVKLQLDQTNFVTYTAVSSVDSPEAVNTRLLCTEKIIRTRTIKSNGIFLVVSIINTKFDDHIILKIYVPSTKRQYQGKIMTCYLETMIKGLIAEGKIKLTTYEIIKIDNKKKYFVDMLLRHINVVFKDFEVFVTRKTDNLFRLNNYIGILKELLYKNCKLYEGNLYLFEVLFDITDNIFSHMPSISVNKQYSPSFMIKVSPFRKFGVLNFKVTLKEFIEYVDYTKKNMYNLNDLLDMAEFIFNNFMKFWKKIDTEDDPISFSDILYKKKFKLNTASAIHTNRYPLTISKIRYPVMLIQKPFSLKPKQLCIIFLESSELIKVIIYNLMTRKSVNHYFRLAVLEGIFSITEYLVKMNLLEEAGNRLYKIIKNRYLCSKVAQKTAK